MAGPCPPLASGRLLRPPARSRAAYVRSRRLDFTCGRADTGRVSPVAELLFAVALPTLAGFALIYAWRGAGWLGQARASRRAKALPPEPLERLQADALRPDRQASPCAGCARRLPGHAVHRLPAAGRHAAVGRRQRRAGRDLPGGGGAAAARPGRPPGHAGDGRALTERVISAERWHRR